MGYPYFRNCCRRFAKALTLRCRRKSQAMLIPPMMSMVEWLNDTMLPVDTMTDDDVKGRRETSKHRRAV